MNERGELVIQNNDNKMPSWNFIIKFPFVYTYTKCPALVI
jgi:hypothetical protein